MSTADPVLAPAQPFIIASLAMVADFLEDRLRLNAVDMAGNAQAIFLTRRLLDKFIPLLIKRAEKQVEGRLPKELVLSISQHKLRIERNSGERKPVKIAPAGEPWLCTGMSLSGRKTGAVWIINGREGQAARFVMSHANIVSMLDICLARYRAMAWGDDKFPEWATQNLEPGGKTPVVLH